MKETDELIITDDGSSDQTLKIISEYTHDKRIFLYNGPHKGITKNFENGLIYTTNDIILFADQDDYWFNNKLEIIRGFFETHPDCWLVLHNQYIATNEEIEKKQYSTVYYDIRRIKHGLIYNIVYNGYYGCCMGITKEFKKLLLPFPDNVKQHDQWISVVAEYYHKSIFLDEILIAHRIHLSNYSKKGSFLSKTYIRYALIRSLVTKIKQIRSTIQKEKK